MFLKFFFIYVYLIKLVWMNWIRVGMEILKRDKIEEEFEDESYVGLKRVIYMKCIIVRKI